MRFNYLRESTPQAFEMLRPNRVPAALRTPVAAVITATLVVAAWWSLEHALVARAQDELGRQRLRFAASELALHDVKLHRERVADILALDSRLREIRRSGAQTAHVLADIAAHIPPQAWLTSISRVEGGIEIDGRAIGLDGLSTTLADLMRSSSAPEPALVRASAEDHRRADAIVSFTMRAGAGR
jgi:Tfp pilus assembly protein PilN